MFPFHRVKGNLQRINLVDPLIVYADLLATADTRNLETAKIIYGERLAQLVDEY